MKALSREQGKDLKARLRHHQPKQGIREHRQGQRFVPGLPVSIQLAKCGHRARVEARASGFVPKRAKCPLCHRWRNTLEQTARKPIQNVTRTIVDARTELRGGREFKVTVLKTPRRARF